MDSNYGPSVLVPNYAQCERATLSEPNWANSLDYISYVDVNYPTHETELGIS